MATATKTFGTTNTQWKAMINVVDRNTLVWWALLLISAVLAIFVSPWGGLFFVAALAVDDVALYRFGKSLFFDSQLRVRRNYQWIHNLYDNTTGSGRDLGFNLVQDGVLSQRAKFQHIARQLGLQPGMAICDIGCGYGDWLNFCKTELGCRTVGVNITPEQADYARREYGLEVVVTNWKRILQDPKLKEKLFGQFDAVTFLDTVEHYVSMVDRCNLAKQERIYTDMCRMAAGLLSPDSPAQRIFISCLHQTHRPRTWRFYYHSYFMDKMYSGHYPFVDEGPLKLCRDWFDVLEVDDKTEDYRLTGIRDRQHFQAVAIRPSLKKALYMLAMTVLDPFVLHRVLYYTQDSWMYFYGESAYSDEYDLEFRQQVSYVRLFWITLQRKTAPREGAGSDPLS